MQRESKPAPFKPKLWFIFENDFNVSIRGIYFIFKKKPTAPSAPTAESVDPTAESVPDTANDHKERGNDCIRNGKYNEAILHYSFAIKLSPNDAALYSNRSLAFLKLNQLYYANDDAEKAIQFKPDWAKVRTRVV